MAEIYDFKLVVTGQGLSQTVALPIGELVIGRQPGTGLLLDHPQVSRRHVQMITSAAECVLTDLGSSNGTYVNGEKLVAQVPHLLQPGDKIQIGPFVLMLEGQPVEPLEVGEPVDPAVDLEAEPAGEQGSEPAPEAVAGENAQPQAEDPQPEPGNQARSANVPIDLGMAEPEPADLEPVYQPDGDQDLFQPVPSGLSIHSQQLLHYLPGIYQTDFMSRFLGIFESILIPIEWNIDNFDLFLDPALAPTEFLPWLANWFDVLFQPYWTERQRREFLQRAGDIFARRGTRAALAAILQIFTGCDVEINDTAKDLPPYTFRVTLPLRQDEVNLGHLSALIDANKPAYTSYQLKFNQ